MNIVNAELYKSLHTGFIDRDFNSKAAYKPEFLVNDKTVGKKILTTINRELRNCDEFWFSVAFLTTSGIATLTNALIELEEKGIKGRVLVSQYLNFTQPEALRKLLKFKNIDLKIVITDNFHSKGYLFKKDDLYNLIIGSSNLTASALCSNKEWNLKVSATGQSELICNAVKEFHSEFKNATKVDHLFISNYEEIYAKQRESNQVLKAHLEVLQPLQIKPNTMQIEALQNIERLRSKGKTKALLISATGTGKTYLSAFDAKEFNPKKFLFVVHRKNIAIAAMKTFQHIFGAHKTMGLYSGNDRELEKDYIFSTIQTISREDHLNKFKPEEFDYIVIDETHRAGATSYQTILNYFRPKFLLGMTATPERTDGLDIFKLFDHNIAYEIRLQRALEEEMLSPFHYYGVTDISVDGEVLEEHSDFSLLSSDERIDRIIEKAQFYGCDNGAVRGLIFCSKIDECLALSAAFNQRGYNTVALIGKNSEEERIDAINRLESANPSEKIDYIFTVDIFNEGIDIPKVNQVIMLRPTQSAIIFVQQLGRGLRKIDEKDYLTVIDFIGNYSNSYLVPIALYGDTSYNKDVLRKLMSTGNSHIPGTSTVNFDKISKDRIFAAIDSANMQLKKDLVNDYQLLKYKLGYVPKMMDFIVHGSRDPKLYINYSKSYFNFVQTQEDSLTGVLNTFELKLLELFSNEINNSKRVEESIILKEIILNGSLSIHKLRTLLKDEFGYTVNDATVLSAVHNLNFEFITENKDKKLTKVREIYDIDVVRIEGTTITIEKRFSALLKNTFFKEFLLDNCDYSIEVYKQLFHPENYVNGFVLYRKYSRKDAFRILNWDSNPLAQNVGGYMISPDKTSCPIFVNYHKEEGISDTTKYEDGFISNHEIIYMSKSKRKINSPDVLAFSNAKDNMHLPLFVKKHNDEGTEFYYMGDVSPISDAFVQTTMGENVSVVKMKFSMNQPVADEIYAYITDKNNV